MSYLRSYKRFNNFIQNESFEPMISWGCRMALSGTLPILWGLATGRIADAIWITITAEAVSWVEMKGSFSWRVRTLVSGAVLAIGCSLLGAVTGNNIWLSVLCMFLVGFLATLLKNIGDRASGLAICVYMLFIICNAYPTTTLGAVHHRFELVCIGASWPVLVGLITSLFTPAQEPFRRQLALVWRAIAVLVDTVSRSATKREAGNINTDVYGKEKDVRTALDNSFQFYSAMAHQVNKKDNQHYQLVQLRKTAGLVTINTVAIGDEMEHIKADELDETLRVKAATLFSALKEAVSRISVFVITLKPEEKIMASSQINRVKKLTALIRAYPPMADERQVNAINRILQLTDRTVRLLENALLLIERMGKDVPVYRSYSFLKTLFVLKPEYLVSNLRVLFSFNTFTTRYALRSAIAATVALFIFKWFNIDHGYWLPFSLMIVIQPYFGATFKRAIERVVGTLLGGITASLLLRIPAGLHIKESILFLTFILMVYYVRRNYGIAVFIITVNLVLLFNIELAYNDKIMVTRAICTVGGSLLAVISGFVLPTWDKKWLPSHLASAIKCNYDYFIFTFFSAGSQVSWLRNKRMAESNNSNVFDSFNRYMQDPGKEKSEIYYDLITYNVRITRDLNNIHIEQDEKKQEKEVTSEAQQMRINECLRLYNIVMSYLNNLDLSLSTKLVEYDEDRLSPIKLNKAQMVSLEKIIIELRAMQQDIEKLINKIN
jgi:uncharacterized membrane protein YccC